MRRIILVLAIGAFFFSMNAYGADGDLIVNGSLGVGATPSTQKVLVQYLHNSSEALSNLAGTRIDFGAAVGAETITNAFGLRINPYVSAGTIGNMYDIHIAEPTTGGTVTGNHYGIFQQSTSLKNYFGSRMGIGITPSTTYTLRVSGDVHATGGVTWEDSDARFKRDVLPLTDALPVIQGLQGVTFEWNTDGFPERNFSKGRQTGLIAQDAEKVLPEIVKTDEDGYKAIAYGKLTVFLMEAIKEQQAEIRELRERIERMEAK